MSEPTDLSQLSRSAALPDFSVEIAPPRLDPWIPGNIGVPGFASFAAPEPGPHVALVAITHGNEIAGAIVLDRLLRDGVRPARGTLTLGFANLAAYARFDPAQPTASRFVDEDLNRVWDDAVLDGARRSVELDRAREIRKVVDQVDILLDLHSMLWPSDPLMLSGPTEKGRILAQAIACPDLIVADSGHVNGRRMIDYARFCDPAAANAANLLEAGQHWQAETVTLMEETVASLLRQAGMLKTGLRPGKAPAAASSGQRIAEVTLTVTAATASFAFVQAYRGGDIIERRNTLIAMDGSTEIRTPYDNCLLVMPSLRPTRGHTAVRLARFV